MSGAASPVDKEMKKAWMRRKKKKKELDKFRARMLKV